MSQAAFLKRNLDRLVVPTLEIADRSLERILEQGTFEFINDFSSQITVGLLFRIMGLPERDHADIRRKVILAVSTDKSVKGRTPAHIAAFKEISDFLTAEVAAVCDLPGPRAPAELWRLATEWRVRPDRVGSGELWTVA